MNRFEENKLGKKLLEVREAAKLSQGQLVALMKKRGIDVKAYTISKWETGVSKPTVEAFLAICDICRVEDIRHTFVGKRLLRLYDIPVSAGLGNYLEGNDYEMIEVDGLTPDTADYAVRVGGDSMMPRFVDQQIVFIHEQPVLDEGEIGIFCLNNDAYLKKLGRSCLISLNPKYDPIPIREHDEFKVFGKVVG
ncbi:MAG: XRE family transcriptional regulator [Eubacteriales bacterium]|nr:XRE family transcriptional regulator [Eubacteriales bacterium]